MINSDDHTHSSDCLHKEEERLPKREILTKQDLESFQSSSAYDLFTGFLKELNESIKNKPLRASAEKYAQSEILQALKQLLNSISSWIDDIPPADIGLSRFGNPAFRIWHDRLDKSLNDLLLNIIPSKSLRDECRVHLLNSFGDRNRIDYGTGHEANIICFMLCMRVGKLIPDSDVEGLVSIVFWEYIQVMRKLQSVYWLEPAGSHGVWGLDDYQFLPFLFGSGQLVDHKYVRPKSIHDPDVVEELSKDYMYFSCIQHINSIKTESLRWHSPMLDDISGVKKWSKVNEGMFKMYAQEVLNKLPIMQHFLFGNTISFEGSAGKVELSHEMEHVHALGQERPLCCSIRLPSKLASMKISNDPRPVPFD